MDTVDLKLAQDCEALAVAASEGVAWLKGAAQQSPTVAQQAPSLVSELQKVRNQSRKLARAAAEPLEPIEYENLEVSSPGIDRPLMRIEDFERFMQARGLALGGELHALVKTGGAGHLYCFAAN